MKTKTWLTGFFVIVLGFGAVARAQNPPVTGRGMARMGMAQNCPTTLAGVDVAVADTEKGIAVTFTAKAGNAAELQKRVENMANMHRMMADAPRMRDHMIQGDVKYEALPKGARLTLTPKDPARLAEFRIQVRARVEEMKKGNCSMMENMMQGMGPMMGQPAAKQPEGTK